MRNKKTVIALIAAAAVIAIAATVLILNSKPTAPVTDDQAKSQAMIDNAKMIAEKFPLTTELPIRVDHYEDYSNLIRYEITYRINTADSVTIIINDETGGSYDRAIANIKSRGFDADEYDIEYNDLSDDGYWGHAE